MSLLKRVNAAVDWISAGYRPDARVLALLRVAVAGHILLSVTSLAWLSEISPVAFDPPLGPFALLSGPPSAQVVVVIEVATAALAVAVLVGFKTRAASGLLTLVLMTGSGLAFSYGKVDHSILYVLTPLMLGLAGWGSVWSIDAVRHKAAPLSGYAMFVYGTLIAFAMFTAAAAKSMTGWLVPTREASHYFVAADVDSLTSPGPLAHIFLNVDNAFFWKFTDYATVFAESWLVVAVFFPGLFRIGLVMLSVFHLGVWLLLGIDFRIHAFVYAGFLLVPLNRWLPEVSVLRRWMGKRPRSAGSPKHSNSIGIAESQT